MAFLGIIVFIFVVTPLTISFVTENNVADGILLALTFWLILPAVIAWPWSGLMYKNYKYQLDDKGLKTEYGVVTKKFIVVPYDRIQNINVYRGILSRALGLSDLHIYTAGSSGRGGTAEERLPGLSIANAQELQETLLSRSEKMRHHHGSDL
jgi:membrane protein YdbS with pleckstrin-like domain